MAITQEQAWKAIENVMHPSINNTLKNLGIAKDVKVEGDKVYLTIAVPFPNIPILEDLAISLVNPIAELGAEVYVDVVVMTDQERERFLQLEKEGWKDGATPACG